jgi:hypothetical protein
LSASLSAGPGAESLRPLPSWWCAVLLAGVRRVCGALFHLLSRFIACCCCDAVSSAPVVCLSCTNTFQQPSERCAAVSVACVWHPPPGCSGSPNQHPAIAVPCRLFSSLVVYAICVRAFVVQRQQAAVVGSRCCCCELFRVGAGVALRLVCCAVLCSLHLSLSPTGRGYGLLAGWLAGVCPACLWGTSHKWGLRWFRVCCIALLLMLLACGDDSRGYPCGGQPEAAPAMAWPA